jgi:hypothetical protein
MVQCRYFTGIEENPVAKVTVQMSNELDSVISSLASRRDIPKSQVLRRAVALMKMLDDADEKGEKVILRDPDGDERQLVFEKT